MPALGMGRIRKVRPDSESIVIANNQPASPVRVLVFPCGAENGLELHEALSQCVNIEVWGASSRDDHGLHLFKNYSGGIPYIGRPEFLAALNEVVRRFRIECLFPTHDTVVEFLANHRDEIGCRIIMADNQTARICREKRQMHELFADCNFAPNTYETLDLVKTFPIFLKPN